MIFLGDIACPACKVNEFVNCIEQIPLFKDEIVVLNLEATIAEDDQNFNNENLFNSKHVLDGFKYAKKVIVSLANNHMYDYPCRIRPTANYLDSNGIGVFGLVNKGVVEPYIFKSDDGNQYAFFGHCWKLYTHTNSNDENNEQVVDCAYNEFIETVSLFIKNNPTTKVYCFMHWNYDMEKLPFPMHIKIARLLIDNGVYGVIGSHSHRPQAAEIYKGRPIVYGLGNFYLPSGVFFNGRLCYPECSKDTYALHILNDTFKIQWFRTDDAKTGNPVTTSDTEDFDGERISAISELTEMNDAEYVTYFKKNRVKKLLVPVFTDYAGTSFNIKEWFAIKRVKLLRKIKR